MNAVARAIAAAAKAHQRASGVTIRYRRGSQQITLTAVPGRSPYLQNDAPGEVQVLAQARDYLILASEFTLGQPQEGDLIDETLADGEHTFQVLALPGEPCWRWSDQHHVRMRVHTNETNHP